MRALWLMLRSGRINGGDVEKMWRNIGAGIWLSCGKSLPLQSDYIQKE